jgi:hypothetical protein
VLKTIDSLNDIGYAKLRDQLELEAFRNEWSPHILDTQVPRPTELSQKDKMDERNAYLIIMKKTDGHMVSSILEEITKGDAKGAFKALHNFFYNNPQAGKETAIRTFQSATMENTDTNVVDYIALVRRRDKILCEAGGQADADAQLTVLLDGLLPEFDFIKKTLHTLDNLTLGSTQIKTLQFANQESLEHTTKNGAAKSSKQNVFNLDSKNNKNNKSGSTEPVACRMWAHGMCRFGSKCRFGHDGPGAALQKKPSSETLTVHDGSACYYCNKKGHAMRDFHARQEDEDIKAAKAASKVNLADAAEGTNYVFMSHVTTDQNTIKEAASRTEASNQTTEAQKWKLNSITLVSLSTFFAVMLPPAKLVDAVSNSDSKLPQQLTIGIILATLLIVVLTAPLNTATTITPDPEMPARVDTNSFFSCSNSPNAKKIRVVLRHRHQPICNQRQKRLLGKHHQEN